MKRPGTFTFSRTAYGIMCLCLILAVQPGYSQEKGAGLPGAYLRIGVGARAFAMGRAFTGLADDATGCYWNPAGIGQLDLTQAVASYQFLSMERAFSYAAVTVPARWGGTFGVSWIRLGVGGIEGRDMLGRISQTFDNAESAYLLSFGVPVSDWLYAGVTAKYLVHSLSQFKSTGYGFDAGLLIKPFESLSVGAVVQNMGTRVQWNTGSGLTETFPVTFRGGFAAAPFDFPVTFTCDVEYGRAFGSVLHGGMEWEVFPGIGLRSGIDTQGFRAGGFFTVPTRTFNFETNYSFGTDPIDQAAMHRLSFTLTLAPFDYYFHGSRGISGGSASVLDVPDCRIVKIVTDHPELGLINLGNDDGITTGTRFHLYREQADAGTGGRALLKIGTVSVIRVEPHLAAVKFIDRIEGFSIQMGDMLFKISR